MFRQFLLFSSFVFLCCFCTCGIQRTTLVQVYCWAWWCLYILCMMGRWSAQCVHASTKIVTFESLTFERSFQPSCYLSYVIWWHTYGRTVHRGLLPVAHVWSYSTPRAVTVPSVLGGLSPSDLVLAGHYTRLILWIGLSPYGYIASSLTIRRSRVIWV